MAVTESVPPSVAPPGFVRQRHRHGAVERGGEVARVVLGLDRQARRSAPATMLAGGCWVITSS